MRMTAVHNLPIVRAQQATRPGRLILVTGADSGRLDLVVSAVGRMLSALPGIAFVEPVGTRLMPAGGGVALTRSQFAALVRTHALALSWERDGHGYGHSINLLARIEAGETVVAGGPLEAEAHAASLAADVRIVRLVTDMEKLRNGVSRIGGPRPACRCDLRVSDGGDIGATVRSLAAAITSLAPPREEMRKRRADDVRRPAVRSRRGARTRADKPQAPIAPPA